MLLIISAHSFGHYLTAQHYGVTASLPYFVPAMTIVGTGGAFIKVKWPVENRQALIAIFIAGPLFGLSTAFAFLAAGLLYSEVVAVQPGAMLLNESLIVQFLIALIHPSFDDSHDVMLSPMALAGWWGILLNFWHLLPIGKFDGGRVVYALWGYKTTLYISVVSIFSMWAFIFLFEYYQWTCLAVLGVVSMIGLRKQYPHDRFDGPLTTWLTWLAILFPILIVLCFVPEPISFEGW